MYIRNPQLSQLQIYLCQQWVLKYIVFCYINLATKVVVKPNPSTTCFGVPALFPDPVKDIPGNLEELLRLGDLIQPEESL